MGCMKEDVNSPVTIINNQNPPKEYILDIKDFVLRAGPDSIFSVQNLVLDNILVSNNGLNREITGFNAFKVFNIVLTPDSSGAEIGYQNISMKKYDILIRYKDGSAPTLLNAYCKYVGDTVSVHLPNNNLNVLPAFGPHAIKWTRVETREVEKELHTFGTYTVDKWLWRRTRLSNGVYIFIEDKFIGPNNKGGSFNVPLVF